MYIFRAISARCCTTDRLPCQTHQSAIQASDCFTTLALNSDYNDIWVRQCTAPCHAFSRHRHLPRTADSFMTPGCNIYFICIMMSPVYYKPGHPSHWGPLNKQKICTKLECKWNVIQYYEWWWGNKLPLPSPPHPLFSPPQCLETICTAVKHPCNTLKYKHGISQTSVVNRWV